MNPNYGKNFDFDLGIGSTRSRSLNEQKNKASYSSSPSPFTSAQPKPTWQPNKPSWTQKSVPTTQAGLVGLSSGSSSMAGDILGKTWGSSSSSGSGSSTGIGIVNKNPNLFEDLVSSALGQGKNNSNVPLKSVTPVSAASNKSLFSMGSMADSLSKATINSVTNGGNIGSSQNYGGYSAGFNGSNFNSNNNNNYKSPNLDGPSVMSMGSSGIGIRGSSGMNSKKDPFGSLVDFGSKQSINLKCAGKTSKESTFRDDVFGDFQNSSKSNTTTFSSSSSTTNAANFMGSNSGSGMNMDGFGIPSSQTPVQSSSGDPFDMFLSSSTTSTAGGTTANDGLGGGQQPSQVDDWGLDSGFGEGNDVGGSTTELEGLPPPPAGVTASMAMYKGMDNYKQGQYADAIKWLSWAVVILEKGGDNATNAEVLSSRASCYKEVGEYKKAVADCTKVLTFFFPLNVLAS